MTTEIAEYTETERALTLLREQYGKPFDVTTKAGMMTIREALLVAYRSGSGGN